MLYWYIFTKKPVELFSLFYFAVNYNVGAASSSAGTFEFVFGAKRVIIRLNSYYCCLYC